MPNTRADLERLRCLWTDNDSTRWDGEHVAEVLDMAERLFREREAYRRESESWATLGLGVAEERDRCADECERLWAGIEGIADRLSGWTDHDGIGPEDALRALLNPEGSTGPPPHLTCIRCGQTFPEHELSAHLATCE